MWGWDCFHRHRDSPFHTSQLVNWSMLLWICDLSRNTGWAGIQVRNSLKSCCLLQEASRSSCVYSYCHFYNFHFMIVITVQVIRNVNLACMLQSTHSCFVGFYIRGSICTWKCKREIFFWTKNSITSQIHR